MKVDFLIGQNCYGTTSYFARGLSSALKRRGVGCRLFWISKGKFHQALDAILNDPPTLTCSFSDITAGDLPFGAVSNTLHLSLLVDPAIYFLHHLKGERSLIATVDLDDLAFLKSLSFDRAFFLPHAVPKEIFVETSHPTIPISLIGTCIDYQELEKRWKETLPQNRVEQLQAAAEAVLSPQGISCLQALLEKNIPQEELIPMHLELERYVTGKERVLLAQKMVPLGLKVFGKGPWKRFLPKDSVCGAISFKKAIDVMRDSKIVVSSSPRFKAGSHERLFYAFSQNALPLVGKNRFIETNFSADEVAQYQQGDDDIQLVEELLNDEPRRQKMVEKGRKNVLLNHTWDARAKTLVEYLEASSYA